MIQFNLLPDVKLEYVKARRAKHLTLVVSMLVSAFVIVVTGLLFSFVQFGQKTHIKNLTKDIEKQLSSLKSTPDLDKILTIQNQLTTIPGLHEDKPAVSRLFGYIQQLTPVGTTISSLDLQVEKSRITLSGGANDLAGATTFSDSIKFAEYSTETVSNVKVFSEVTTTLSRGQDGKATYKILATYDPVIFDNKEKVVLIVPPTITTRSVLEKPSAIFDTQSGEDGN